MQDTRGAGGLQDTGGAGGLQDAEGAGGLLITHGLVSAAVSSQGLNGLLLGVDGLLVGGEVDWTSSGAGVLTGLISMKLTETSVEPFVEAGPTK